MLQNWIDKSQKHCDLSIQVIHSDKTKLREVPKDGKNKLFKSTFKKAGGKPPFKAREKGLETAGVLINPTLNSRGKGSENRRCSEKQFMGYQAANESLQWLRKTTSGMVKMPHMKIYS